MKRRIRLTEGDLHNIVKESVVRILREEDEENKEWKSPLDKAKESKFKVKGKMDVSKFGKKKGLHPKKKTTLGDSPEFDKLRDLYKENFIRKAVMESVNGVLNELSF